MKRSSGSARSFPRSLGTFLLTALIAVPCSSACADGMMLRKRTERVAGQAETMVASPRQEALLICIDDTIQVTLRTSFRAGPTDVAWIIPVPNPPDRVEEADDAVFEHLENLTAPRFYAVTPEISLGCGRNPGSSQETGRIVVAATGKAGIFDYTVVTAPGTKVLVDWLSEHKYHIPDGSERILSTYVDQGWCWLAIRLNSQRFDKGTVAPRPIRYTYHDKRCVYPLIISQLSADDDNEIVLYILSRCSYGCENWAHQAIPRRQLKLEHDSASGTNYERVFHSLTTQAGGRLFVREFVQRLDHIGGVDRDAVVGLVEQKAEHMPDAPNELHLTRLRAIVRREGMDRDVVLIPTEYTEKMPWNRFEVVDDQNDVVLATVVLSMVLLLSTGYLVHRRTIRRRLGRVHEV